MVLVSLACPPSKSIPHMVTKVNYAPSTWQSQTGMQCHVSSVQEPDKIDLERDQGSVVRG